MIAFAGLVQVIFKRDVAVLANSSFSNGVVFLADLPQLALIFSSEVSQSPGYTSRSVPGILLAQGLERGFAPSHQHRPTRSVYLHLHRKRQDEAWDFRGLFEVGLDAPRPDLEWVGRLLLAE